LCRPIVRWPHTWGHHGVMQQVRCTRADAVGMVSIDLSGICGWSPTRAHTRSGRGGLFSPNSSMATHLETHWRGATGPLHSRGCSGDGQHRSLWHLRVVANSCMHAVGTGRDLRRPIVRWPHTWGQHGVVQQVRCTRADAVGMISIDLSGICGWSPTRACTRLGRVGLVSPNSSMATHLRTPWRGEAGPLHSRGYSWDGQHRSLWHLRVVANLRMHAAGAGWTCVAQ